jgi:hypothetical protein
MSTREAMVTEIHMVIKDQLERIGFLLDSQNDLGKYIKKHDWGTDYCFLPIVHFQPEHVTFSISIHRRINFIEEIWQEWRKLLNVNIEDRNDLTTLYITEKNAYPEIVNEKYYDSYGAFKFEISSEGLREVRDIIETVFTKKIEVKLNEFRDLKNIDKLLNSDLDPPQNVNEIFNVDGGFMFKRMIVAKSVGNPIYERICSLYLSRFENIIEIAKTPGKEYFLNYPIVFEKVREQLKGSEQRVNTIV